METNEHRAKAGHNTPHKDRTTEYSAQRRDKIRNQNKQICQNYIYHNEKEKQFGGVILGQI
jgi:hypothetical protein